MAISRSFSALGQSPTQSQSYEFVKAERCNENKYGGRRWHTRGVDSVNSDRANPQADAPCSEPGVMFEGFHLRHTPCDKAR